PPDLWFFGLAAGQLISPRWWGIAEWSHFRRWSPKSYPPNDKINTVDLGIRRVGSLVVGARIFLSFDEYSDNGVYLLASGLAVDVVAPLDRRYATAAQSL